MRNRTGSKGSQKEDAHRTRKKTKKSKNKNSKGFTREREYVKDTRVLRVMREAQKKRAKKGISDCFRGKSSINILLGNPHSRPKAKKNTANPPKF